VAQDEEYDAEELSRKLLDHALFVGYAPADDPQIAVAVIVEHGGSGSRAAAPIARRVMDAWLVELPQLAPTATVDVLDATPLELPASSDQE
jgi:penicillin-binding protein 2